MIKDFKGMYQVQNKDIHECGRILTDAFRNDPKWGKLFEGIKDKHRNAFYQEPVSYCIRYGKVFTPSKNMEGVMAIVPGKYSEMTVMRVLRTCRLSTLLQGGITLLRFLSKLDSTFNPLEDSRRKIMKEREYIYIFIIGVKPKMQGKGFGGKLLTELCDYADRINIPIYLETETIKNVNMYEKYGFKVTDEIIHPEFNLPQWAMIREAR